MLQPRDFATGHTGVSNHVVWAIPGFELSAALVVFGGGSQILLQWFRCKFPLRFPVAHLKRSTPAWRFLPAHQTVQMIQTCQASRIDFYVDLHRMSHP